MPHAFLKSEHKKLNFTIATRGSELALWQARSIQKMMLEFHPEISVKLLIIKTAGDIIQDRPLSEIGGKGLFVKELEKALLEGKADLAVHSMKDVTSSLPEGLEISAITKREDPGDAWISPKFGKIEDVPIGSIVGTSSLRRKSQLKNFRPDLRFQSLRGNVQTRIRKINQGEVQATILAVAGLNRCNLQDCITEVLPMDMVLPAIGQGAIGIETRIGDSVTLERVKQLNDRVTWDCLLAERELLRIFDGNCQIPLAGYCNLKGDNLELKAAIGDIEGKYVLRYKLSSKRENAIQLGKNVADWLLRNGAEEIIHNSYKVEVR